MKTETECIWIESPQGCEGVRPWVHLIETETNGQRDVQVICSGYTPITLVKEYGPMIFANLRIRADSKTCQWIIERDHMEPICIPGQLDEDFEA